MPFCRMVVDSERMVTRLLRLRRSKMMFSLFTLYHNLGEVRILALDDVHEGCCAPVGTLQGRMRS